MINNSLSTAKGNVSLQGNRNISYFAFWMLTSISYKSKQFLWLVFKLIILVLSGFFIYHTLTNNSELSFDDFQKTLNDSRIGHPLILLFLIGFTTVNWIVEITKWNFLANQIKPISFQEASMQSLASHAFSLVTPNRIGEYGAKALFYQKSDWKKVVLQNFIGNFYQLLVTIIIGSAGIFYVRYYVDNSELEKIYNLIILGSLLFGFVLLFRHRLPFLKKWLGPNLTEVHIKDDGLVLLLSLLRYLVFSHQFYFLILVFDVKITYFMCMSSITAMYFISSVIPMLSVFDFVVKGSVAVFVFSFLHVSPLIVLSITTLMWLLNFVLPAVVGSYFVLKFKPVAT
jgi:hypothetical protein